MSSMKSSTANLCPAADMWAIALRLRIGLVWLVVCVTSAAAQFPPLYRDELGYDYTLVVRDGMLHRQYLQPHRAIMGWEVRNHLAKIGLPDDRLPAAQTGLDAWGRPWQRDALGYPFHWAWSCGGGMAIHYYPWERQLALETRQALDAIVWPAAAREGVRRAVVRGFNQIDLSQHRDRDALRSAVRDAIVHSLNTAGRDQTDLSSFKSLVQAGIEDAIVEAFNSLKTSDPLQPPPLNGAAPEGTAAESGSQKPNPARNLLPRSLLPNPLPPSSATPTPIPSSAAKPPVNSSITTESQTPIALSSTPVTAPRSAMPARSAAATTSASVTSLSQAEMQRDVVAVPREAFRRVETGWVLVSFGIRVLNRRGGYELRPSSRSSARVDIWADGELLYQDCRYFRHYEDALAAEKMSEPPSITQNAPH